MLDLPVVMAVANTLSPLRFSKEEGDVILQMAGWRQPVVISNMILAGISGPVSLPELLALENAEVLAGVVLTQLVSPGTPVLYGSSSAPIDMRTMVSAVGTSEAVKIASATAQMAGFYKLPCRAGAASPTPICLMPRHWLKAHSCFPRSCATGPISSIMLAGRWDLISPWDMKNGFWTRRYAAWSETS